ncbi:OB-fold domain-containing protein [Halococcus saccharolyticus]|uniref:ChsH2 C-terminal OB-fold domain-containing protein n=1 Tax=Halococcus saccharolyticus DSM 5350 TaxID=1227455 RepID=M0MI55_9EURY|nr:OB-fold domain-containing protein [Halococcus saccharolyticus]EMA45381.1 hypothetical protein C449_07140 [Halococcus saccharolyticus DSM 5350]
MSHENDDTADHDSDASGTPPMEATRYADGSITYPGHPIGPDGTEPVGTVDLSDHTATVVTWTTSTAPPPGVDAPNHLAIVAFEIDGKTVRALGQLTTDEIAIGDEVTPVYAPELRDPEAGIREPESQDWDGYRFEPV